MKKRLFTVCIAVFLLVAMLLPFGVSAQGLVKAARASEPTLTVKYQNLSFRDNVVIKYAVELDGVDSAQLLLWTSPESEYIYGTQDKILTTVGYQKIDENSDTKYWIYDYTDLSAKQMTDEVYVRAYARVGDKDIYSDIKKYSIVEYAMTVKAGASSNEELARMVPVLNEMLEYGAASQLYFNYRTDRLATADFYRTTVVGGTLSDGTTSGIYPAGATVALVAPATDAQGYAFQGWVNEMGVSVASPVTTGSADATYTAVFDESARRVYEHVVIVGVDGGGAWFDDADMPNVDAIFANAATTDECVASFPTISYQCWASLLTGVSPVEHGINMGYSATANDIYDSEDYPTVFKLVKTADPTADLAVFATWAGIKGITETDVAHREVFTSGTKAERDRETTDAAVAYIKSNQPKLTFIQLDSPDGAGETDGFGTASHLAALNNVDGMIGDIYGAVEEAGMLENTLFIVTADHGGYNKTHGGSHESEYNVFFGMSGASVIKGNIASMYQRDIPAMVCWALDVEGNDQWDSYIPMNVFRDNRTPEQREGSAITEYIPMNKLEAGLHFDDYNVVDMVGTHTAEANTMMPTAGYNGGAGYTTSYSKYISYKDLTFGTDSFAISSWVKYTGGKNDVIYGNQDWSKGYCTGFLLCWNGGKLRFNVGYGEYANRIDMKSDSVVATEGEWVHTLVVVDRENKVINLYANFRLVATATILDAYDGKSFDSTDYFSDNQFLPLDGHHPFNIGSDGRHADSNYSFDGVVDDFLVFNDKLTASEMATLKSYYFPAKNLSDYVNTDKLASGLTFDNNTLDAVAGNYTITATNASYVEGYDGMGFKTGVSNGTKSYITYEDLTFGTESFALAMWIKSDAAQTGDPAIYGTQNWANAYRTGFLLAGGKANQTFTVSSGIISDNYKTTTAQQSGSENGWIHTLLIFDRENSKVKLYINFELAGEGTLTNTTSALDSNEGGNFHIGADGLLTQDKYFYNGTFFGMGFSMMDN